MDIQIGSQINPGLRKKQQDAVFCEDLGKSILIVVIDGVGGCPDGAMAAKLCMETITSIRARRPNRIRLAVALNQASVYVFAHAVAKGIYPNGCALTVAWIDKASKKCFIGHVGDTRCYLSDAASIKLLTRDHTKLGDLDQNISEHEWMKDKRGHALTRCIGELRVRPQFMDLDLGDLQILTLLLCSDGSHDNLHSQVVKMFLDGLFTVRSIHDFDDMRAQIRKINLQLGIDHELLLDQLIQILARSENMVRTPQQIADDLVDASLAYQPFLKKDNVTVAIALIRI